MYYFQPWEKSSWRSVYEGALEKIIFGSLPSINRPRTGRATLLDSSCAGLERPLGNGGRVQWVSGRPGEAPAYAGTDFIIARDGRIAALYLFFDKLP
jgi:hypothetical protein